MKQRQELKLPRPQNPSDELYPETISIVDGHYFHQERAGAYLIVEGDEAAFVDNITRFSVPHLLDALKSRGLTPQQLRYIIVTHIHLDHSGGTAELAKHCPEATVLCHPRAAKHIIDPERLVKSAKMVYGEEEFLNLYGEIGPVDERRVRIVEDNEVVDLGSRKLTFLDSPGHARHHHAIHDSRTNSVFAGDVFGTHYRQLQTGTKLHFTYVCAPPEFDPAAAKASIQRVLDTGADRVFVTHYGASTKLKEGAEILFRTLDDFDALARNVAESDLTDDVMLDYCLNASWNILRRELKTAGLNPDDPQIRDWATKEHMVTAQGIEVLAKRRRKEAGSS